MRSRRKEAGMVELRKIDENNFRECLDLKVFDGQANFVATNEFSLAQAWVFYDKAFPFAIYADDQMVGFVMMGYDSDKKAYNIWRFMIDARFQNKGYGKAALQLSIDYLIKEYDVNEIYLSFEPENIIAEKLYSSYGFVKTGEVDYGELVMRLAITKN
jgi:diamine N-acetyltransferase